MESLLLFSDSIDMRQIESSFIFTWFAVIFDVLELDKNYNTQLKGHFLHRKLTAQWAYVVYELTRQLTFNFPWRN